MDIDGFILRASDVVPREQTSDTGALGTVDRQHFIQYVREKLVPILGNFSDREPRSIVVMDESSTHMCEEVCELIEGAGAYVLFMASNSPDLNPIAKQLNVYKAKLRRSSPFCDDDNWYLLHVEAATSVTRDSVIEQMRHCGLEKAYEILTSSEHMRKRKRLIDLCQIWKHTRQA